MTTPATPAFDPTRWRKSSISGSDGGCVEMNDSVTGVVGLRDSKRDGAGPELVFSDAQWTDWLGEVAAGVHTGANGVVLVDEHEDGGWTIRLRESGTALTFTAFEVACFRHGVAANEFGIASAA